MIAERRHHQRIAWEQGYAAALRDVEAATDPPTRNPYAPTMAEVLHTHQRTEPGGCSCGAEVQPRVGGLSYEVHVIGELRGAGFYP